MLGGLAHIVVHRKCAELHGRAGQGAADHPFAPCRVRPNKIHCAFGFISLQEFVLLAIFQAAGWPIWLLLVASIVATALIIERLLYLRRSKILPKKLLDEVVQVYRGGNVNTGVIDKLEKSSPLGVCCRPRCAMSTRRAK